mmetsp:Transcript_14414/g.21782  ORF Transcript_14414/g.21782 Transcript_14414/m.21782 type:complete len:230 (-) Transcript_14414:1984-2673(-)
MRFETRAPTMIRPIENTFLLLIILICCHFQLATAVSQEWCLERGFDPSNLSCDTCALLEESTTLLSLQKEKNAKSKGGGGEQPIDVVAECRTCCQAHKVNPILHPGESLRGKYRYALLTYDEHTLESYGEIKDFIDRDMDDVLSFKGENRFRAVKSEKQERMQDIEMMMRMGGMMGGFGGGPPKLMLFEKQKKGGWSEDDEEEAGEVIALRGWKREDVKDMLLTLLPNS